MKRKLIYTAVCALMILAAAVFVAGKDGWSNNNSTGQNPIISTAQGTITILPPTRGTMSVVFHESASKTNASLPDAPK